MPQMLKQQPDQVTNILNDLIDEVNTMRSKLDKMQSAIDSIECCPDEPTPTPPTPPTPPVAEWQQTLDFDIKRMGTTPGMCLQNCREGFGIPYGRFPSALADMEYQRANGTLHTTTPPDYLQVPVYIDTSSPYEHVVVWDKGTVYSDGVEIRTGLSGLKVFGWGELCDGRRVVSRR